MSKKFADTDWVDNLTGPLPLDKPAVIQPRDRSTMYDSSRELAAGAEIEELELSTSMMGLFS